jgi:hypothetical protein
MGNADHILPILFAVAAVVVYFVYLLIKQQPEPKPKERKESSTTQANSPGERQLDRAITAIMAVIVLGMFILIGRGLLEQLNVWIYGDPTNPMANPNPAENNIWKAMERYMGSISPFALIFDIAVYAAIGYGIYWFFAVRPRNKKEFEASPEHAFKVSVAIKPIPVDSARLLRGRKVTHSLSMDIKISPKDWKRIDEAGLMDASLFDYPNQVSFENKEREHFLVSSLRHNKPMGVQFYDIGDAEEAKEKLLKNLYMLKDAVEAQKEGVRSESFEI